MQMTEWLIECAKMHFDGSSSVLCQVVFNGLQVNIVGRTTFYFG